MAPIPRCDLRLPVDHKDIHKYIRRISIAQLSRPVTPRVTFTSKTTTTSKPPTTTKLTTTKLTTTTSAPTTVIAEIIEKPEEILEDPSIELPSEDDITTTAVPTVDAETIEEVLDESKPSEVISDENGDEVPEPAHEAYRRDSAEILENAPEFKTELTRDTVEVHEHKIAEGEIPENDESAGGPTEANGEIPIESEPKDDVNGEELADADVDDEPETRSYDEFCPTWIKTEEEFSSIKRPVTEEELTKGFVASEEPSDEYRGLFWGSPGTLQSRLDRDAEMRQRRQAIEMKHKNALLRRLLEKRKARENRRAFRSRDQSKIPQFKDDMRINKAYGLLVSYKKNYPMMPAEVDRHLKKFKKPPFKSFVADHKTCFKRIDEYERLRVVDNK